MGNLEHDLIERGCRVLDPGWHEGKDHEPEGEATWDEAEEVLRPALDQLKGAVDLLRELSERWTDVRVSGNAARVAALGDAVQRARDLTGGQ